MQYISDVEHGAQIFIIIQIVRSSKSIKALGELSKPIVESHEIWWPKGNLHENQNLLPNGGDLLHYTGKSPHFDLSFIMPFNLRISRRLN